MPYSKGVAAPKLANVRKLVVASAGLALLVASTVFGQDLTGASDEVINVFDAVAALLTATGVYAVPNVTASAPPAPLRKDAPGFGPDGKHRI